MGALKVISFLNRREDLSLAQFSDYWRTVHRAHALKLVEAGFIQGYIQNHPLGAQLPGLAPIADGSPELWIETPERLQQLVDSAEYREGAGPDEANFTTPPVSACLARERVLLAGEPAAGAVKLMLLVRRNPRVSAAAFAERWLAGESAPLLGGRPLRVTRHAVEGEEGLFDGAEFSWWPDPDSLSHAWQVRNPVAAGELLDRHRLQGLLAREEWVVRPEPPEALLERS